MEYFLTKFLGSVIHPLRMVAFWISKVIPGLKKVASWSLATRIALLVFLALTIISVGILLSINYNRELQTKDLLTWVIVIGLVVLISFATYFLVRLLQQKDVSDYPEIDDAWDQGLDALRKAGIDIKQTPIYLMIGNSNSAAAANFMAATKFNLNVNNAPGGSAALHWYANPNGIFLFCTQANCLSVLHDRIANPSSDSPISPVGVETDVAPAGGGDPNATLTGDVGLPQADEESSVNVGHTGTIVATEQSDYDFPEPEADTQTGTVKTSVSLTVNEANLSAKKLEHVCKLLRRIRQPVCPANGIMALCSYDLIKSHSPEIQTALQRDLETMRNGLKLRCSVTFFVTDMQSEGDFSELVTRVGEKVARDSRIGKGFNVWADPTDQNLSAVARHACGLVEDFGYKFFRERNWSSNEVGNRKLFALICKIRGRFSDALSDILSNAIGYNVERDQKLVDQTLLFNGCYFGATGPSNDEHAFVKSTVIRMMEQEEELAWTDDAVSEDTRCQMLANVFGLIGLISLIALIWIICGHNDLLPDALGQNLSIFQKPEA